MADTTELERALINADAAGDTAAAKQLAAAIIQMRQATSQPKAPEIQLQPDSLGRQAGLFARHSLVGIAGIPSIATEPIRNLVVNPALKLFGQPPVQPLTQGAEDLSDWAGLPKPQTKLERIVGKGTEMGMGAAGMAGAAQATGNLLAKQLPDVVDGVAQLGKTTGQKVAEMFATNPGTQAVAGASGGMAGQQAKENGAGFWGQLGSTVLGGLGGAGAMAAGKGIAGAIGNALNPALSSQIVDQRITQILINQGIDPASIGPAILSKMREDVAKSLKIGGTLNDDAVARLADYARVGATPTRAGITLDPYDVTLQRNASKLAAATGQRDGRLPGIATDNTRTLQNVVTGMGPNPDRYAAGQQVIASIGAKDAALTAEKKGLYDAASAMAGGEIPVDRGVFTNAAFEGLIKQNKMAFLPESVGKMLDQISKGEVVVNGVTHPVPFNVNTIDALKTTLATASRSADGNGRAALAIVRNALETTPINPTKATFGGGQVVSGAGASFLKGADAQAADLLGALDKARAAARGQFAWQESAPGIDAALGGAIPDSFIHNQIIAKTAGYDNVAKLAATLQSADIAAVKGSIVQHLLESATQRGREVGASNFNGPGLSAALKAIGDRKMALFFSPDEIEMLKSAGRVGGFETFQPTGSAVNNSNTGAAMANILQGIGKFTKPLANRIPFGAEAISGPLDYMTLRSMESPALNLGKGLLSEMPKKGSFAAGLLGPGIYAGGLLGSP
jgi:hypothetical protein